jgi:protocatechuate 3,4-dioxygenase alpha subunit
MNYRMKQTPSQTVGPYFAYGLTPEQYRYDFKSIVSNQLVNPLENPNAVTLVGQIFDGQGQVIPDALVEIWDSNTQTLGRFGTGTTADNSFQFIVQKPSRETLPFLTVIVFMRGLLLHTYSRIYFADETEQNEKDSLWQSLPVDRRHTLLAQKEGNVYRFDIHMQGPDETIFLDI